MTLEGGHEAKAVLCLWLILMTSKIVETRCFCNSFHSSLSSFWESSVMGSGDNVSSGLILVSRSLCCSYSGFKPMVQRMVAEVGVPLESV